MTKHLNVISRKLLPHDHEQLSKVPHLMGIADSYNSPGAHAPTGIWAVFVQISDGPRYYWQTTSFSTEPSFDAFQTVIERAADYLKGTAPSAIEKLWPGMKVYGAVHLYSEEFCFFDGDPPDMFDS